MSGALADGLYEHVLTNALAADLSALDAARTATIIPLDPADSHSPSPLRRSRTRARC